MSASPAAATSGRTRLVFRSSAPANAPVNIATTAAILRAARLRLVRGSSPGWEVRAAITSEPEGVQVK